MPKTIREMSNHDIRVGYKSPKDIKTRDRQSRRHSEKQIGLLMTSIALFGFLIPILVNSLGQAITGHARLEAAIRLGLKRIPVIQVDHLSEAEQRTYALADNRLAEYATWDERLLGEELFELEAMDLDFDLSVTGFDSAKIEILIDGAQNGEDPEDQLPDNLDNEHAVTRFGDQWALNKHRLDCANALEMDSYDRLLGSERAQVVFSDPPFNTRVQDISGLGRKKHSEFRMASGEMSSDEFSTFLLRPLMLYARYSIPGSIHYICMDWRHMREILDAGGKAYTELKNLCVWAKSNGGMGSLYRSRHELVFVFKNGTEPHINNIELGRHGRYRTNVWEYAGNNSFHRGREEELASHPTVKPIALVADAIRDCSKRGGIVLDAFGGSGTTLLAAERTGRRAFLMELEPKYVDTTIKRYEKMTGRDARHIESGLTFKELARVRAEEAIHV